MIKNRILKFLYLLLAGLFLVGGLIFMLVPIGTKNSLAFVIGGLVFVFGIVFMVMFLKTDDTAKTEEEAQIDSLLFKMGNLFGLCCLGVDMAIFCVFGNTSIGKVLLLLAPTIVILIIALSSKENIKKIKEQKTLYVLVLGYLLLNGMFCLSIPGIILTIIVPFIVFIITCSFIKNSN